MIRDAATRGERLGFTALVVGLLSPVLAHGLWRPLGHSLGLVGTAQQLTLSALGLGALSFGLRIVGRAWPVGARALLGGLAAITLSATLPLGLAGLGALLPVAGLGAWLLHVLPPRLPEALDGLAGRHRVLATLYALKAAESLVALSRLSVFIGDPRAVNDQVIPGEHFTEVHSCLSAYARANELARQGVANLYADSWWHGSLGLPPLAPGAPNPWAPFELDNFSYPPPFLLLTAPLAPLQGDFLAQRALWFGLNGLLAASGIWAVARWIDGPRAHRVVLLAPLFFASLPALLTLQIGNFHLLSVVLAVMAMVAFDRGRAARGGAMLALTILSKIAPGLLGVVLLVRRRYRDAAITAGFGLVLLGLSAAIYGLDPLRSFVSFVLPRLSSGQAFPFMETDAGIATNMSVFGTPFKLRYFGWEVGDPWIVGKWMSRVYTIGLFGLAIAAARRQGDRRDQAIRWMSLLTLGALQSPFSPAYVLLGLLWATTLLAVEVRRWREGLALAAIWPVLLLTPPGGYVREQVALGLVHTILAVPLLIWLVLRAPRSVDQGAGD